MAARLSSHYPPRMPVKVVINRCYGGFELSHEALKLYKELTKDSPKPQGWHPITGITRDNPNLVFVVEHFGRKKASGNFANLKIIIVPDDVEWEVQEHDGMEWVAEKHRVWYGSEDD
jgi:hypothetical protein